MSPPVPNDEMNANLCELRRQIGYLPLLSQYESQTDIVNVLMGEPYRMPDRLIERLIRIADLASICQRCMIAPEHSSSSHQSGRKCNCIAFDASAAFDVYCLVSDLLNFVCSS